MPNAPIVQCGRSSENYAMYKTHTSHFHRCLSLLPFKKCVTNPNKRNRVASNQRKRHISLLSHCHNAQFRQLNDVQHCNTAVPQLALFLLTRKKCSAKSRVAKLEGAKCGTRGATIRIGPIT